jgi:alkylated DNA nucleotide flippase Atl1
MAKPRRTSVPDDLQARDRLLLAATELLDDAQGGPVSTRQITERAGVGAPTLYHHFGSKQALLDAVVSHGFKEFLRTHRAAGRAGDPIDDIREGWDSHVAFGLEFPSAYAHIYGNVKPGVRCGVAEDVRAHLLEALESAAAQGRLRVSTAQAAAHILAASSGVILTLIQQPEGERDLALSDRVRDSVLAAITVEAVPVSPAGDERSVAAALKTVSAALDDSTGALTAGERALMHELLARLAMTGRHSREESRAEWIVERVRAIPEGYVRTYGDIDPGAPRLVGRVLATTHDLPWHRVVRADGTIPQGEQQRALLRAEGVPMRSDRVDLSEARLPLDL